MKLDIRTAGSAPRRQTFGYLARRFGEDRPATRYEEAVLDIQSTENFHYRAAHDPDHELYDRSRTAISLEDWNVLLDPRQLYYATYNISRAAMEAQAAKMFEIAAKHGQLVTDAIVPLRHYEWGANRIAWSICERGYGTPVTSAAAFAAMDRLGIAQHVTKLGLAIDGQTGASLDRGKDAWLTAPEWQGARRAIEDMFVLDDWFEALVALFVAFDPVVYKHVVESQRGTMQGVMATEMLVDIRADQARWVDAIVKIAGKASPANQQLIDRWTATWSARAKEALHERFDHADGNR